MSNEADTCRKYVIPRLEQAGWYDPPHSYMEQKTITDGRIVVAGDKVRRKRQKRPDYLLRYRRDFTIAVVEAKREYKLPSDGMQQAKDYAEILDLKFAYSTNGTGIVEFDYLTGVEREIDTFPSPAEMWSRLESGEKLREDIAERLLTPSHHFLDKVPRYYQEIAINRTVQAILQGKKRILLTMATGTGKTLVAFQICWKLWNARWNRAGRHRRPRILYLADRNILVDDPKDKDFVPFGDARHKIEHGEVVKSREMYFSTYQSIAEDERRPGLYKEYSPDFFDLIVVDECHRGSARDDSNWRKILTYFKDAYQLGMTATPLREDNRDTYDYFDDPIYTYSLRQGIEDGFLAPYRVHRVITTYDAAGWRPSQGELDRYGREIPDQEYHTQDFERVVSLRARTECVARHLAGFMKQSDRFAKTIVFCVDQEHADEMRRALNNRNADLVQRDPNYVCRITSDEGTIGRGHLSNFQEPERRTPVIVTTSKLLTTGVDVPTCKNVVLVSVINSMTEFKQIIGRGTRVRDDYGKLYFNILDYTGSATRLFADPSFDGDPVKETEIRIDADGKVIDEDIIEEEVPLEDEESRGDPGEFMYPPKRHGTGRGSSLEGEDDEEMLRRKYYVDNGYVDIVTHLFYELDPTDGKQLRVIEYTDYTGDTIRTLYPSAASLRRQWADPKQRQEIIDSLQGKGIEFDYLRSVTDQPEADPFDLLCHLAYNAPLRTRRERAARLRQDNGDFFDRYGPDAREILDQLLEKYAEHGVPQFTLPDVLKLPPIFEHGNPTEIARFFGGPEKLREAVEQLQTLLYAA